MNLWEHTRKERDEFENSFNHALPSYVFDKAYQIRFYNAWSYFIQEELCFLGNTNAEYTIAEWLSGKEKPLEYLYNAWMNSDEIFSEKFEDMSNFLHTVYEYREDFDAQYNQAWQYTNA
jgi:hypothetical protein